MSDLAFYNHPIPKASSKSWMLHPFRRVLRKSLLPFFQRQVEIYSMFRGRLERLEATHEIVVHAFQAPDGTFNKICAELEAVRAEYAKLQEAHTRLQEAHTRLQEDVAAVVALNWDHGALARRLAQLEDRLILDRTGETSESYDRPEGVTPFLKFPGLDRYIPGHAEASDQDNDRQDAREKAC